MAPKIFVVCPTPHPRKWGQTPPPVRPNRRSSAGGVGALSPVYRTQCRVVNASLRYRRVRPYSPSSSSGSRDIWHPEIPIRIEEIHFAQAVRLVRRFGEDREAVPPRRGFCYVRVTAMQAQLSTNAARAICGQARVERVLQIGMIGVQHPPHLAITQDG